MRPLKFTPSVPKESKYKMFALRAVTRYVDVELLWVKIPRLCRQVQGLVVKLSRLSESSRQGCPESSRQGCPTSSRQGCPESSCQGYPSLTVKIKIVVQGAKFFGDNG